MGFSDIWLFVCLVLLLVTAIRGDEEDGHNDPAPKMAAYTTTRGYAGTTSRDRLGVIMSPGYPGNYPNNYRFRYDIYLGKERSDLELNFKIFDLESCSNCDCDFLMIENYKLAKPMKYCGAALPNGDGRVFLDNLDDYVWITFQSNSDQRRPGFYATYEVVQKAGNDTFLAGGSVCPPVSCPYCEVGQTPEYDYTSVCPYCFCSKYQPNTTPGYQITTMCPPVFCPACPYGFHRHYDYTSYKCTHCYCVHNQQTTINSTWMQKTTTGYYPWNHHSTSYRPWRTETTSYRPWRTTSYQPWRTTGYHPWRTTSNQPWRTTSYRPWRTTSYQPWRTTSYRTWRTTSYQPWRTTSYRPWRTTSYRPWHPETTSYRPWHPETTSYRPWRTTSYRPWRPETTTYDYWRTTIPTAGYDQGCGTAYFYSTNGNILSPGAPGHSYPNYRNCEYNIDLGGVLGTMKTVSLRFSFFDMERCGDCSCDALRINSNETGNIRMCDSRLVNTSHTYYVHTTSDILKLNFTSDGSVTRSGFSVYYEVISSFVKDSCSDRCYSSYGEPSQLDYFGCCISVDDSFYSSTPGYYMASSTNTYPSCGTSYYDGSSGRIMSPGAPYNQYANSQDCRYDINLGGVPGSRKSVALTFNFFDLEKCSHCQCDALTISSEETDHLQMCDGTMVNTSRTYYVHSSSDILKLHFTTDGSVTRAGFSVDYVVLGYQVNTCSDDACYNCQYNVRRDYFGCCTCVDESNVTTTSSYYMASSTSGYYSKSLLLQMLTDIAHRAQILEQYASDLKNEANSAKNLVAQSLG